MNSEISTTAKWAWLAGTLPGLVAVAAMLMGVEFTEVDKHGLATGIQSLIDNGMGFYMLIMGLVMKFKRNETSTPTAGGFMGFLGFKDPKALSSTSRAPSVISLLAVLLTIGMLGGLSGCGATLGDLKPSSESSRKADGTEDNTLMIALTRKWYREICHPAATDLDAQNACFDRKEYMLDQLDLALSPMQARKRDQARPILTPIKGELLDAGTDAEDKRLKGWFN